MIRLSIVALILLAFASLQNPKADDRPESPKPITAATVAGNYFEGDGFRGTVLILTEDRKFSSEWSDDTGHVIRHGGTFEIVDRIITFQAVDSPKGKLFPEKSSTPKLHVIPWRNRIYLIEEKDLPAFCGLVNLGVEPRSDVYGIGYVNRVKRKVDGLELAVVTEMDKPIGLPELPDFWKTRLLKQPLEGKIVEKLANGQARVNLGSADGLQEGMVLLVDYDRSARSERPYRLVRIQAIENHRCTIVNMNQPFLERGMEVDGKVRSRIEDKHLESSAFRFRAFSVR